MFYVIFLNHPISDTCLHILVQYQASVESTIAKPLIKVVFLKSFIAVLLRIACYHHYSIYQSLPSLYQCCDCFKVYLSKNQIKYFTFKIICCCLFLRGKFIQPKQSHVVLTHSHRVVFVLFIFNPVIGHSWFKLL